jgi:hypothetical protein
MTATTASGSPDNPESSDSPTSSVDEAPAGDTPPPGPAAENDAVDRSESDDGDPVDPSTDPTGQDSPDVATSGTDPSETGRDRRAWIKQEGGYVAELSALCGLVFARPVLAAFGQSPETFIARGASAWFVLIFGLIVALGPVLVLGAVTALSGLAGRRVREAVQLVVLGYLAYLGFIQVLRIHFAWATRPVQIVALLAAVAAAYAVAKLAVVRTYVRFLGAATLVFLGQFLFISPSASLIFGGRSASVDDSVAAAVAEDLGEDAPPVVMVMLDALPTASLMDTDGEIDADLYPNLAALAGDGTWYRNHTTVAQDTVFAVPAALSGEMPSGREVPPVASSYPDNLFTLLGGSGAYELDAVEQVTALCPDSMCPHATDGALRPLLADGRNLWEESLERGRDRAGLPGAFGTRYVDFAGWVDQQRPAVEEPSTFRFYHVLMPHDPWNWLPGGQRYHASMPGGGQFAGYWGPTGSDLGLRRQVLQTQVVDEQLGRLFEGLRRADLYDDALIVVTADHGYAFEPQAPVRALAESQPEQILWTPLLVKAPGQTADDGGGVLDEENVMSVDVVAIGAAELGIDLEELDFRSDGVIPAGLGGPGRDAAKVVLDWSWGEIRAEDGEDYIPVDAEAGYERLLDLDLLGRLTESGSPDVWDVSGRGLVGSAVGDDLPVGEPLDVTFELDGPVVRQGISLEHPLPLELSGIGWISEDETVVLAVGDTVAALVRPEPTGFGVTSVRALLWPGAFVEGDNEISVHLLGGDEDTGAVLHPLEVTTR